MRLRSFIGRDIARAIEAVSTSRPNGLWLGISLKGQSTSAPTFALQTCRASKPETSAGALNTDKNYLGTQDNPLPIIPGMVATVEVLTGKKSVRAASQAFGPGAMRTQRNKPIRCAFRNALSWG